MAFLDVSSVVWALREHPHEFFMRGGCLEQRRSAYRFKLDQFGLIFVQDGDSSWRCLILGDDVRELISAFEDWRRNYWTSTEINRTFARQLRRPGLWCRLRYWLECRLPERRGESALATYAYAFVGNRSSDHDPGGEPPPMHPRAPRPPSPVHGNAETVQIP
jgi:hypothetical protein